MKKKDDLQDEIRRLMNPGAAKELAGLSPTFQQFLIRWVDLRDMAILDETKDFIQDLYEKDNEAMCRNVTNVVAGQLAETLAPFAETLERVERNIQIISSDVSVIKSDILDIKKRLKLDEDMLIALERRVDRLEKYASVGWTVVRNIITAFVSISIGIILFLEIHSRI
jgi:hypothetical protein